MTNLGGFMNNIIQHIYTDKIFGATTLKANDQPEKNNMALHVCLNPDDVLINRKKLANEFNMPLENWALPWQKHTDQFYKVTTKDKGRGAFSKETSLMNVDAIYTTEPNILIGVFTADCLGILLVDETSPCVCCIHSGWKGTIQQITDKTVKHLIDTHTIDPKTTSVYFSPSILYDSLEVGMEVVEQLKTIDLDVSPYIRYMPNNKAYIDNQGINMEMLLRHGIPKENIHASTIDTKKALDIGFSFRNDKQTGEHFTFGFIKK